MVDLHQEQFEWLLEHAKERAPNLGGEDPVVVAMHWAREVGITLKAMAKVLGLKNTASVRNRLYRLNERIKSDRDLRSCRFPEVRQNKRFLFCLAVPS
jgi:hypothetical protein